MIFSFEIFNPSFRVDNRDISYYSYAIGSYLRHDIYDLSHGTFHELMCSYRDKGIVLVPDRHLPRFLSLTKGHLAVRVVFKLRYVDIDVQYVCISPEVFASLMSPCDYDPEEGEPFPFRGEHEESVDSTVEDSTSDSDSQSNEHGNPVLKTDEMATPEITNVFDWLLQVKGGSGITVITDEDY